MRDGKRILRCEGLGKVFPTREGATTALRDVSFHANEHEFLTIVGPSGCGKTTLLKIIAGLLEPSEGEIRYSIPPPPDRPRAALVFQEHALLPWLTVKRNVELAVEMRDLPRREKNQRVLQMIRRVGLEGFENAYPHELSFGMRQRVALSRAFLAGSPILLMDEPFAALDAQTRRILREDLLDLWREDRKLILYVTHDIEEAVLIGDRILVLTGRPGHVVKNLSVPLPRAKKDSAQSREANQRLIGEIWAALESDIRLGLRMPDTRERNPI